MTAQTFRIGKIVDFLQRLMWRREMYAKELDDPILQDMRPNILRHIQALDLVIREIIKEFEISEDEFVNRK